MVARCSHFIDVSDATKPAFWQPFLKDSLSLKLAAQNSSKFHTCLIIPMHLSYWLTLNFSSFSGGDRNLSGNIWAGTNNLSIQKDQIAVSFCWSAIGMMSRQRMIWSFPCSLFQLLLEIQVRMNHDNSWWTAVIFVGYISEFPRCQEGEHMFQTRWILFQVYIQDLESVDWTSTQGRYGVDGWLVHETHPPEIAGLNRWCFEKPDGVANNQLRRKDESTFDFCKLTWQWTVTHCIVEISMVHPTHGLISIQLFVFAGGYRFHGWSNSD